jgi:hypothetical protein
MLDQTSVCVNYFLCPNEQILDPLATWLARYPKFKIFYPVVVPYPVLMVNVLSREQLSPEVLLHDESMFGDIFAIQIKNPIPPNN